MKTSTPRWFAGIAAVAVAGIAFISTGVQAQTSRITAGGNDAATAKVGEKAPAFTLEDVNGNEVNIMDHVEDGKIVVLEWWNPKCPFVVKHYDKMTTMSDTAARYADDVVWVKINSTNSSHRDFGVDKDYVSKWNLGTSTVLLDADGEVGKMYGARVTPHMFIIDTEGVLRYNGAIDSDRGVNAYDSDKKAKVTNYVDQALKEIIAGETVTRAETRPYGCSVKYAR